MHNREELRGGAIFQRPHFVGLEAKSNIPAIKDLAQPIADESNDSITPKALANFSPGFALKPGG